MSDFPMLMVLRDHCAAHIDNATRNDIGHDADAADADAVSQIPRQTCNTRVAITSRVLCITCSA